MKYIVREMNYLKTIRYIVRELPSLEQREFIVCIRSGIEWIPLNSNMSFEGAAIDSMIRLRNALIVIETGKKELRKTLRYINKHKYRFNESNYWEVNGVKVIRFNTFINMCANINSEKLTQASNFNVDLDEINIKLANTPEKNYILIDFHNTDSDKSVVFYKSEYHRLSINYKDMNPMYIEGNIYLVDLYYDKKDEMYKVTLSGVPSLGVGLDGKIWLLNNMGYWDSGKLITMREVFMKGI